MNDSLIIRMAKEISRALSEAHPFAPCPHLVPSYNALLNAAKANHPSDPFLGVLSGIEARGDDGITIAEMRALLGQIRIALESLQGEAGAHGGQGAGYAGSSQAHPAPMR